MFPRRTSRWNRSVIVWGLLVFVVLQLGTALWSTFASWRLRDPEYAALLASFRRSVERKPPGTERVVMIGSSRTRNGFEAELLEAELERSLGRPVCVFNFGFPGGGALKQWCVLRRLLTEGPVPDRVLIELAPVLLRDSGPLPADEQFLTIERVSYAELCELERIGLPVTRQRAAAAAGWAVPWHTYRLNVLNEVGPSWLPPGNRWEKVDPTRSGWMPIDGENVTASGRSLAFRFMEEMDRPRLADWRAGTVAVTLLQEMLAMCRQRNIPAALVYMPEGPIYRSYYGPQSWQRARELGRELSRTHDVPLINARRWQNEEDFVESNHLLTHGAVGFTKRLAREFLVDWMKQTSDGSQPSLPGEQTTARHR